MSYSFQKECLCDVIAEVEPLLKLHYSELTLNREVVKLAPDWNKYVELEHAGAFHVFTARDGSKLIGYSAFFLSHHLHYKDLVVASNDVLYLDPGARNGMTGIRLIKNSEAGMKAIGAAKITWHAKYCNDLQQILMRLGYTNEEAIMGKLF